MIPCPEVYWDITNPIVKWRVIRSAIFIHETPNDWDVFLCRSSKRYVPQRLLLPQVLSDEEVWDKRIYRAWPQIPIALKHGPHLLSCLLNNCIFLEAMDSI